MKFPSRRGLLHAALSIPLIALAAPVGAQQAAPAHVDLATGLRFPPYLAQLRFQQIREFPNEKLGYCALYSSGAATAQVCVYDLGYERLPTGIDSPGFKEAVRIATEGFVKSLNMTPYAKGRLVGEGTPSVNADGKIARAELRMLNSELTLPDHSTVQNTHLLLMTAGLGKILKLNYSQRNVTQEVFSADAERLINDFYRFNQASMKTLLLAPGASGQ